MWRRAVVHPPHSSSSLSAGCCCSRRISSSSFLQQKRLGSNSRPLFFSSSSSVDNGAHRALSVSNSNGVLVSPVRSSVARTNLVLDATNRKKAANTRSYHHQSFSSSHVNHLAEKQPAGSLAAVRSGTGTSGNTSATTTTTTTTTATEEAATTTPEEATIFTEASTNNIIKETEEEASLSSNLQALLEPPPSTATETATATVRRATPTIETIGQRLILYQTRQEALQDYNNNEKALIRDVIKVVNHYTKHGNPIVRAGTTKKRGTLLSRQLGTMMHTLVLPTEIEQNQQQHDLPNLFKGVLYTLRAYARDAARPHTSLTLEDALTAQALFHKLASIPISKQHEHTACLCLNNVLQTFTALSGPTDSGKLAAQHAEHLLVSTQQQEQTEAVSQISTLDVPDVVSFNTVMSAWVKCISKKKSRSSDTSDDASDRALAMLNLLVDLSSNSETLKPTSVSYDIAFQALVEQAKAATKTRQQKTTDNNSVHDDAMELLDTMVERANNLQGHPAPTARTLVQVYKVLSRAQLQNVRPYIKRVETIREQFSIPHNTILSNAALTAYFRSKPATIKDQHQICQDMNHVVYNMEASLPSNKPDKISYQTVLQAWVDCGRRLAFSKENSKEVVENCAKHAERHLEAARNAGVGIDVHMVHHVLAGFAAVDPSSGKRILQTMEQCGFQPTMDCYGTLLDSYKNAVKPKQEWHAQAANDLLEEMQLSQIPDSSCFNSCIMAWCATQTRKGAQRAAEVLRQMCGLYEHQLQDILDGISTVTHCRPNVTSFMTVLTALSKYGDRSDLDTVEDLIYQMHHYEKQRFSANIPKAIANKMARVQPNLVTYNVLLNMYGRLSQHDKELVPKAEDLFERLTMDDKIQPDRYSCSALLKVYQNSKVPASQIMALVDKMQSSEIEFDLMFFNQCLQSLAECARVEPGAVSKARAILDIMESGVYGKASRPDEFSYASVALGYKTIGTMEAARTAEELMNRFDEKHTRTGLDLYNTVMATYAETKTPEGQERALKLLDELEHVRKVENRTDVPDIISYNIGILVSDSPQRAKAIYELMMSRYRKGELNAKPRKRTFGHVLNALSRDKNASAEIAEFAEKVLMEKEAFHSEDKTAFATAVDYHVVVKLLGTSEMEDGPERAEALLEQMVKRHESGEGRAAPDCSLYKRVLLNYYNDVDGTKPDAAARANAVLERMIARAQQGSGPAPDRSLFVICMTLWANSGQPGCDVKVEELLNRAKELDESGTFKGIAPDAGMYWPIIKACANAPTDSENTLDRGLRIFGILKESPDFVVSHSTYRYMFTIVGKFMKKSDPRRVSLFKSLFKDCCRAGQLSNVALEAFVQSAPDHVVRKALGVEDDQDLRRLQLSTLPAQWSQNVRKGYLKR